MEKKRGLKGSLGSFLRGIPIGVANVIPGVSGGTIALLMGIYDRLMDSIGNFFKDWKDTEKRNANILFLVTLGAGAAAGVVAFFKLVDFVLEKGGTLPLYFLFAGLIAGSVPLIIKIHNDMAFNFKRFLAGLAGFVIVLALILTSIYRAESESVIAETSTIAVTNSVTNMESFDEGTVTILNEPPSQDYPAQSFGYYIWLAICGFVAAGSMIVPGFSGSALLVALGEWANIGHYISVFDLVPLGFVAIGAIFGIFVFAKVISICLKKFPSETYYFILGLIFASFYQIWLKVQIEFASAGGGLIVLSIALFCAGFAGAFFMSKLDDSDKA